MSGSTLTDDELKKKLTPEQYHIMREKETEPPFTGKYWKCKDDGTYTCAACGKELFKSDDKFNSGCGWPSFDKAIGAVKPKDSDSTNVIFKEDTSNGMQRTEVLCKNCHSHLGHIFDDGPTETGMRYCINSACLNFKKKT